jgi:hypothetical protein
MSPAAPSFPRAIRHADHLRAAIANVTAEKPHHFEQAIFADELSEDSLNAVRELVRTQWQTLLAGTVPTLQELIDTDQTAGRARQQRVRIGLYSYTEPMQSAATQPLTTAKRAARRPPPSTKEE